MMVYKVNEDYVLLFNKNQYYMLFEEKSNKYIIFKETKELLHYKKLVKIKILEKVEEIINNIEQTEQIIFELPKRIQFFKEYYERPVLSHTPTKNNISLIHDKKKVESHYHIINDDKNKNKYYFNKTRRRYELLTEFILGRLIEEDFDYILDDSYSTPTNACLTDREVHILFQMFRNVRDSRNSCINFKNKTIDTKTWGTVDDLTFTIKNNDYCFKEANEVKKGTLTERVLRQIFVNKETKDETLYYDFLQRLGASFLEQNKHKFMYMMTGSGNDGKSIVLNILRLVHQDLAVSLKVKNLTDSFYLANLSDTNVMLIDELSENSFNRETTAILKDISGRGVIDSRMIYSHETVQLQNYGVPYIATNIVPYVPFNDIAYWQRLHLVRLPNKFVEKDKELGSNEYVLDSDLEEKLALDVDGIEWLISASIMEYRICNGDFYIKQSAADTQFIYDGGSPLRLFIERFLTKSDNPKDIVSVLEIKYYFLRFCIKNNISDVGVSNSTQLNQEIGYKIRNHFTEVEKQRTMAGINYRGLILSVDDEIDYDLEELKEKVLDFEEIVLYSKEKVK